MSKIFDADLTASAETGGYPTQTLALIDRAVDAAKEAVIGVGH